MDNLASHKCLLVKEIVKKYDKIYPKLIDTKINYNSSQLTASK